MNIRLDHVSVTRDGREILSAPRLDVWGGRTTAILGPNGAGKTTVLRLVAGLERPDRGQVLVGGEPADVRRRCVGYVFQEEVFLRRTLLENLSLGLQLRGRSRADARTGALRALRRLGIEALADRRADRVSGGEARRATLARALCLEAPVLLLDEPTAGLDGATYARLLDDLPAVIAAAGATTLLVTHDADEAFRLCDDVVVMVQGRVIRAGAKRDVAEDPRYADVAAALGYAVLVVGGRRIAVPPGELQVSRDAGDVTARVEAVLDLVRDWDVVVTTGGTRLHVRAPRDEEPPLPGDEVAIRARVQYPVT